MKLFTAFLSFVLGCTACASAGEKLVDVSPLDEIYDRESPVVLVLRNVGHRSIRVYSNLEVVDEHGEWVTWPFRIEDGRPGAVSKIHALGSGDSTNIEFDVTKIALPPIPPGQSAKFADRLKFRFRISVLQAAADLRLAEIFTEPFVVRYPYGRK